MWIGPKGTRDLEMARKAKDTPHLRLRIEPSLLARLEKSADKNGRTLTGEIVDRLDGSFRREDMQAIIEATAQRVSEKMAPFREVLIEASRNNMAVEKGKVRFPDAPVEELVRLNEAAAIAALEKGLFDYDLKQLKERFPDTPGEEHAQKLREVAALRAKIRGGEQ
jgi:hypothetical protein